MGRTKASSRQSCACLFLHRAGWPSSASMSPARNALWQWTNSMPINTPIGSIPHVGADAHRSTWRAVVSRASPRSWPRLHRHGLDSDAAGVSRQSGPRERLQPEGEVVRRGSRGAELAPLEPADQVRVGDVSVPPPEGVEGRVAGRLARVVRGARNRAEGGEVEAEPPRMRLAVREEPRARTPPAVGREKDRLAELTEPRRVEAMCGEGLGHGRARLGHRLARS